MSKYTTELRFICETYNNLDTSVGLSNVNTVIDNALPKLFDFSFPIFDENYRKQLEHKIVRHFYLREIGFETVGVFKFYLENKLNEIMPYYNKIYNAYLLDIDPLSNYRSKKSGSNNQLSDNKTNTTDNRDSKQTSMNKSNSNDVRTDNLSQNETHTSTDTFGNNDRSFITNLHSDTPQGSLQNVENESYLSSAEKNNTIHWQDTVTKTNHSDNISNSGTVKNTSDSSATNELLDKTTNTSNSVTNITTTNEYVELVTGYSGVSAITLIKEYTTNLDNVDMLVIEELEELFMQIF